jgi:glucose-6-phosphate-specific signal transduction histidine kinase
VITGAEEEVVDFTIVCRVVGTAITVAEMTGVLVGIAIAATEELAGALETEIAATEELTEALETLTTATEELAAALVETETTEEVEPELAGAAAELAAPLAPPAV